jgi:hypothetical protein
MQQRLARHFYETRPTYALKRATWVGSRRQASASSFPETFSFSEQMQRGYLRSKTLSEEEKQSVFEDALRKGWLPLDKETQTRNCHALKEPEANPCQTLVSSGFMLTWNQPEVKHRRVQMLFKHLQTSEPGSAEYEKLMNQLRQEPMFIREWDEFKRFCNSSCRRLAT